MPWAPRIVRMRKRPIRTWRSLNSNDNESFISYKLLEPAANAFFYRVDLRPSIPEYFDTGEVPVLAHVFEDHPDITHIVHFADHTHWGYLNQEQINERQLQVVPRIKGQPKAGLLEAIFEQVRVFRKTHGGRQPHLIYASTGDVYKYANSTVLANDPVESPESARFVPPFTEETPITTPSSIQGASKLLDEVLAKTYWETEGIFSIGLRFFQIYGPWGLPGSPIFEMAERAVAGESPLLLDREEMIQGGVSKIKVSSIDTLDDIRDFLYIDDAMDAVMAAMQFRPRTTAAATTTETEPRPVVINVGSGTGVTLRQVAKQMTSFFPLAAVSVDDAAARAPKTISFASTARAQELLGFTPRISLQEGLERLLAWHFDRAFPYGAKPGGSSSPATDALRDSPISKKGIVACNKYDLECLRGTPIFPCASECAHDAQCFSSFWDDVVEYTKALTNGCEAVMYTIALDDNISLLPSTVVKVSEKSRPFVDEKGHCNVAFVSEQSVLYRRLSSTFAGYDKPVQHGKWNLVPVHITDFARKQMHVLGLLPKLSPGKFFGLSTRYAVYADPDIIFHSIPKLLTEVTMQPFNSHNIPGSTALLIGKRRPNEVESSRWNATRPRDQVQDHAYRMIRLAVIEEMTGDGFAQLVDSSFVVHELSNEDSRLFRCDVYGEVVQWDASSDRPAFQFTMALHDMWSRIIAHKMGLEPWWIGDEVPTVDRNGNFVHNNNNRYQGEDPARRLQGTDPDDIQEEQPSSTLSREQPQHDGVEARRLQADEDEEMRDDAAADDAIIGDSEHNGFGLQDAANIVFGSKQKQQERLDAPQQDDDFELGDDWARDVDGGEVLPVLPKPPKDPSTYDVWMGILSSTSVRSFSRIVNLDAVGAVKLENYEELAYS